MPIRILMQTSGGLAAEDLAGPLADAGYDPEFETVRDAAGLEAALESFGAEVVVAEPEHPPERGTAAVLEVVERIAPDTPVILCARERDESEALRAIVAGAHDFVPAGDRQRVLAALVRAARESVRSGGAEEPQLFKAYFRHLFENSPEAIVILDSNETIVDVNRAFVEMFQYTPEEVRGLRISDVIVPEGKQEEYSRLRSHIYGGRMVRRETTRRRKDGSNARVSVIGCPIMLGHRTFGVYAIYSDISRQIKAIQTLRQAESNYRNFFLNAVEGMYISSPLGRFVTVNPAMAELLGYDSPSDLTDSVKSIAREVYADPDVRERLLERIEERGRIKGFRAFVRRRDGSEIEVCENARAVRDEDGELLYYQGTMVGLEEFAPGAKGC
jgi:PAS domain S-box-containing protein